jgi:hypothetical protein
MSGFQIKKGTIPYHEMVLVQCGNGSLFAKCSPCNARLFVADHGRVSEVMDVCNVVATTQPPTQKERKR